MQTEKRKLIHSIFVPFLFVAVMWLVKFIEWIFQFNMSAAGIYPRELKALPGIITTPLIHGDFAHLFSNSIPLIILGGFIIYFYPKVAYRVFWRIYLFTGILIWLIARPSYHIGASGLVYGFVTFLFFSGIFRADTKSIAISLLVTFLYGGLIWGIFPVYKGISWEAHLLGALVGALLAFIYRNIDPPEKFEWEEEEDNGQLIPSTRE